MAKERGTAVRYKPSRSRHQSIADTDCHHLCRHFCCHLRGDRIDSDGVWSDGCSRPVRWSKDFLEAGKKRLAGDTARAATSDEVNDLRREAMALKEVVADLTLENRLLKKSVTGDGEDGE